MSILEGTTITPADRAAWLAERQNSLGSSEAASAIGISPYETPLQLYLRKTGAADPVVETSAMRWGTRLEPVIAEAYSELTGRSFIAEQKFVRSPIVAFMTATLDRVRDDGRIVELKTVGARSAHLWGEEGSDELPHHYLVQVLHQLICTGTEVADVAALIGGQELRIYEVARDDDIAGRIVAREAEFWSRVTRREPPPIDHGRDGPALARLWPAAEGAVDLGPAGAALADEYEAHGREIRRRQEGREQAKSRLLASLKDAASGRLPDGRVVTRRVVNVGEQQVTRKSYTFIDMRIRNSRGD